MKTCIIAEGSHAIGGGHQVRMGALARVLAARGHTVELRARELPGAAHRWAWEGLPVRLWPAEADLEGLLDAGPADWVVADHLALDGGAFRSLASRSRLLVVDDVPGRELAAAERVLNYHLGAEPADYRPQDLVGPRYALVRSCFAGTRRRPGRGLMVMLGATDAADLLPEVVARLAAELPQFRIEVVCSRPRELPGGARQHRALPERDLARLMAGCRAAVLTASSGVYEPLALGLPFVAVHTATNQDLVAGGLRRQNLAPVVRRDEIDHIPALVRELPPEIPRIVDGRGPHRVAAVLEAPCTASSPS